MNLNACHDHDIQTASEKCQFYLRHWHLIEDGFSFHTRTSCLQPVRCNDMPAMLKIALTEEECRGNQCMAWWNGNGAARVLAHHGNAILLERAMGRLSLADMARNSQDDQASRIICQVVAQLHATQEPRPAELLPLSLWFHSLLAGAQSHGDIFVECASIANDLLTNPQDLTVLHGDIHHANILDFESNGWRAIDPKGLFGERAFDYANILCNPDHAVATTPGRVQQQIDLISNVAQLNHERLLRWIISWAGLSAIWHLEDGESPNTALAIATIALEQLQAIER